MKPITNELATKHGLHIEANEILVEVLLLIQGQISDRESFVASFVPLPAIPGAPAILYPKVAPVILD